MRSARRLVALALTLLASGTGTGFAAQSSGDNPANQETFAGSGRVVLRTAGSDIVVALDDGADGMVDRLFLVATSGAAQVTEEIDNARVALWQGRLLVVDPAERRALLFADPAADAVLRRGAGRPGPFVGVEGVKESLRGEYEVSHVEDVQWISSQWGRLRGLRLDDVRNARDAGLEEHLRAVGATLSQAPAKLVAQNPTKPGEGSGGCGVSCSQSCSDGSGCSIACNPPRCATCSCDPGASCRCQ